MAFGKTRGDLIFDFFNVLLLVLFSVTILVPFLNQITISLSPARRLEGLGMRIFPTEVTFTAYRRVIEYPGLYSGYLNTILRTVVGTTMATLTMTAMAYPLSKRTFILRHLWTSLLVFVMFFSGGLIPSYLLMRNLGLIDTRWALILPILVSPFTVFIIRNFMMSLPVSLEESLRIDGAHDVTIFFRLVLPLSKPVIAVVVLWTAVGHWNAWFDSMIYIIDPEKQVVQIILREILTSQELLRDLLDDAAILAMLEEEEGIYIIPESLKAAMLMVVTVPILCVYPFLQRHFVKGIMLGSLRG